MIDTPALGVDFGNVIIHLQPGNGVSFYDDTFLSCPQVPGSFSSLKALSAIFQDRIYIISKCSVAEEQKIMTWLNQHSFFAHTGISSDHIIFCRTRAEKGDISSQLHLTHFIDDTSEVLENMPSTVLKKILFQSSATNHSKNYFNVASWDDVLAVFKM